MPCVHVGQSRALKPLAPTATQLCEYNAERVFLSLQCSKHGRVIFSSLSSVFDWNVFRSPWHSWVCYIFSVLQRFGCRHTGRRLPLWKYTVFSWKLKKKEGVEGGLIIWGLRTPRFIESLNYSWTGIENIALPFPLLGKYASSQERELKHKDKWTSSCQEKPAALCPCLPGPALPLQLPLPKWETSTRA